MSVWKAFSNPAKIERQLWTSTGRFLFAVAFLLAFLAIISNVFVENTGILRQIDAEQRFCLRRSVTFGAITPMISRINNDAKTFC